MGGNPAFERDVNLFREYQREFARRTLPDLSEASDEETHALMRRLQTLRGARNFQLAGVIMDERNYRNGGFLQEEGVSDLYAAEDRLEESLREQDKWYAPREIIRMRLECVQTDLADPIATTVTVKPPSGYEISISKPDARAILLSMGLTPATQKPYDPVWPQNR